jgi:TonB family protein
MSVRVWALAAGLMAAVPAFAQGPATSSARTAMNWETLVKLYPPRALAAREQGLVGFLVTLDSRGQPTQCRVTHSSGYPLLDQETCQLITLHAVFKPANGVAGSQTSTHQGVVNWRLPTSTASAPLVAPKPVRVADAPEKIICKRVPRTGSNVGTERVCLSRLDWDRTSDESRKEWDDMRGKGMTNGN